MAATTTSTLAGTIQKYFEDSWMEMPEEELRLPLANNADFEVASIPANGGQYAEFRKFGKLTVEAASATDDTPKTYAENTEPSAPVALSSEIIQVPFELLRDYVDLGNVTLATDPTDLMRKNKDALTLLIRRKQHQLANSHMVKQLTRVLNSSDIPAAATYLPAGFKCIYTGGAQVFNDVTADHLFTVNVFKKARTLLANAQVPRMKNGRYLAIVDEAIVAQLLEDSVFRDIVKRHQDTTQKSFGTGSMLDWEGMTWLVQDDPYRCNLAAAGGALANRKNTGKVRVAHVLGKGAFGYVDAGKAGSIQRRTLRPTFKVQDISLTGTNVTVGYTMAFQACVLDDTRGLNIAGCSQFDESVADLA